MMAFEAAFGHDVQDALTRRFEAASEKRVRALSRLRNPADARRYVQRVRRSFVRCFPMLPRQRTALTPRVTGTIELPGIRIEKVMFQSRHRFWVTANLYLPRRGRGPYPAILISSGHDADAKAAEVHQNIAQSLAAMGYVALAYDPLGQGERFQYRMEDGSQRDTVHEHIIAGNQLWLVGDFLGSWRAWDGIRAIDYLLTRPEVDRQRLGMHGCSGGGTLTSYISLLDDRLSMIAPSCFGMPYVVQQEMEAPADSEQNPWGPVGRNLDFGDLFVARAPRPTLLMLQQHDFFSLQGNLRLFEEVQRVYRLLGAAKNVRLQVGNGTHGVADSDALAMFRFFNEFSGVTRRPQLVGQTLPPEKLHVTPHGQLDHGSDAWRVRDFTARRASKLALQRRCRSPRELPGRIIHALQLPPRHGPPRFQLLKGRGGPAAQPFRYAWRYVVYPEPGIRNILRYWSNRDSVNDRHHYSTPPLHRCETMYLPHQSSVEDVQSGVACSEGDLYTLDVRGIGEMRSLAAYGLDDFLHYCDADFFHASGYFLLGEIYLGKRVHDALCSLDLLQSLGMRSIHLHGRGLGAIVAVIAAVLHPLVQRVTLIHSPPSFSELAQASIQQWPASVLPFDVLSHFDLTDCYKALGNRLTMVEPWSAEMKRLPPISGSRP
jgi:fermentation-respiration switch protein FrsA (DUF1100 family)